MGVEEVVGGAGGDGGSGRQRQRRGELQCVILATGIEGAHM